MKLQNKEFIKADGSSYAINGKNTKTGKITEDLELL